jgi:hypothetical protein
MGNLAGTIDLGRPVGAAPARYVTNEANGYRDQRGPTRPQEGVDDEREPRPPGRGDHNGQVRTLALFVRIRHEGLERARGQGRWGGTSSVGPAPAEAVAFLYER